MAAVLGPLFLGLPAPFNWLGTHAAAFIIAFGLVTFLHVVFGELLPKSLAIQRSEQVALRITRPLTFFLFIFRPLLNVLNGFANWVLRKLGLDPTTGEGQLYSMEELRLLISASNEAGLIHRAQGNLVDRALTMGDRKALAYMTPAVDLEWVDADRPVAETRAQMLASPYSRFPVRIGDGGQIGIVTAKTILGLDPALSSLPPEAVMEAVFVPEHARVLQVMEEFRRKHLECVLILDESSNRGRNCKHFLCASRRVDGRRLIGRWSCEAVALELSRARRWYVCRVQGRLRGRHVGRSPHDGSPQSVFRRATLTP